MQAWEYVIVVADLGERDVWRPWKVNDKELPNWSTGPSLYDYMSELGALGWELVSAMYSGPDRDSFIARLFFKRPKMRPTI